MTSVFNNGKRFNAAALNGLPDYLAQSDLYHGSVECSCRFIQALPGMPTMCPPVNPEFVHAVCDLVDGRAAVGWNNDRVMAEDTVEQSLYVAGYTGRNIAASKDGNPLKLKADLPERIVILLSFPYYLEDEDFKDAFELFKTEGDEESRIMAMANMYANAYYRDGANKVTAVFDNDNLHRMSKEKINDVKYIPSTQIGTFQKFANADFQANTAKAIKLEDIRYGSQFNGAYQLYPKEGLTPEQLQYVIEMDDTIIVPDKAIEACELIYATKDNISPVRNILLTGLPGSGKTEMAKAIAASLGQPFYMTQLFDLFTGEDAKGTFQPIAGKSADSSSALPTAEDIAFDPEGAYFTLTGTTKPGVTSEEVLKLRDDCVISNASGNQTQIGFVPGVIVHACEPCVIFIDEITSPKNPAAITVFNSLLDRSSRITLTDGSVIHRHKNCIIICAGNFSDDGVEMDGFRDPNRSFLDRFDLVYHLESLSADMIKAMLIANNPNWDEQRDRKEVPIDAFVAIIPELRAICQEFGEMFEFRAVNAWFRVALITRKPIASALITVIGITTRQVECQAKMMAKIKAKFRAE